MNRRILRIVALSLVMIFALTACGSGSSTTAPASSGTAAAQSAPAASDKTEAASAGTEGKVYETPEYEWKFGDSMSEAHPLCMSAQAFADKLFEITNGRCHVTVYPNSTLGSLQEMAEQCDLGLLEFFDSSCANFSTYSSKFYAFNMPYLFYSVDVAYAFEDGEMGKALMGPVGDAGFSCIGFWENGMRCITSNKKPIVVPEDAVGLKIRTMNNKVHMTAFEQVGASPSALSFSELFTALQQNVIDAQENPCLNIKDYSFYEVQDYLTVTQHFYDIQLVCANTQFLESLPDDVVAAINEAMEYAVEFHRRESIRQNEEVLQWFRDNTNMEVIEITQEQKEAWHDAMAETYNVYRDEIGADYLDAVVAEVNRLQAEYEAGTLDTSGWR